MRRNRKMLLALTLIIAGITAGFRLDHYIVYNVKEWTEYEIARTQAPHIFIVYKLNESEREQIMITDDIAEALNYTCKEPYSKTTVHWGRYYQYTPFKVNNYVTVKFNDGSLVIITCEKDILTDRYSVYVKIEGLRYMRLYEGDYDFV